MNIKEFYLKTMFEGYTDSMPFWLQVEADKDLDFIDEVLSLHL